jgi:UDP-2-acetamido-3-amino-2,3-dideoxy-glucuronate N-acetyltransferase
MGNAHIGRNCIIGQNCFIAGVVGNGCKIQNGVNIFKGVTLEDGVFVGPEVCFTNVLNPRAEVDRKAEFKATLVKEGASLGANCTVVCGNTIGRYAFVGAGAVVTHDVPNYAIVYGNCAKIAGYMCCCGERIHFAGGEGKCEMCGMVYGKGEIVERRG